STYVSGNSTTYSKLHGLSGVHAFYRFNIYLICNHNPAGDGIRVREVNSTFLPFFHLRNFILCQKTNTPHLRSITHTYPYRIVEFLFISHERIQHLFEGGVHMLNSRSMLQQHIKCLYQPSSEEKPST